MRLIRSPRTRALALLGALLCASAPPSKAMAQQGGASPAPRPIPILQPGYRITPQPRDTAAGVLVLLSEWRAGAPAFVAPPVRSRPLTAAEAQRVLARLRPIRTADTAADSFFFAAETLPPPRVGRTVAALLPPGGGAGATPRPAVRAAAVLEVARRAPEGPVDREAAEVLVTFSQPMVPLSAVGDVQAPAVPVRLSPLPEGAWRWLDTRTLRFAARAALPAATEYTVEIPAGTRSATGAALAEPVRWSFRTPAPTAIGAWPQGFPTALAPLLVVAFDQRVDAAAVLRATRLRAGAAEVPLRVATAAEVAADTQAARLTAGLRANEWVAFRPASALPAGTRARVTVGPGTPSAEGPRATDGEQYWEFTTHGPFRLERALCDTACPARQPIAIHLSNPVDARTFRQGMVRVEPVVADLEAWISDDALVIDGDTRAGTRYTVRVDSALRDVYGQPLASSPATAGVTLPYAAIGAPRAVAVLDPLGPRATTVMTVAHGRVRLRVMRVRPEDWFRFLDTRMASARPARLPGMAVVDREVAIDAWDGDPHPLEVDVSAALDGGVGHALVAVEALDGATDYERRQAAYVWVQGTRIGLGAFADQRALTAWGTSLLDGSPLAGTRAELVLRDTADGERSSVIAAATLDARGIATLPLPADSAPGAAEVAAVLRGWFARHDQRVLVARRGGDVALLAPEMINRWDSDWPRGTDAPKRLWYGFTDRTLYRPGETVRFKGWVRAVAVRDGGPALPSGIDSVRWTAFDERRSVVGRGVSALTALGGFDGRFAVPAGANLGGGHIILRPVLHRRPAAGPADAGSAHAGSSVAYAGEDDEDDGDETDYLEHYSARIDYRIDEFRRPEYTVTATAGGGPHFVGGTAEMTARATYLAGGALPGAPVTWEVSAGPGSFAPPGWSEWTFGDGEGEWSTDTLQAATDAQGRTGVRITLGRVAAPTTYAVHAEATVTDVNRQTWTAREGLVVHPASLYVGLRPERP